LGEECGFFFVDEAWKGVKVSPNLCCDSIDRLSFSLMTAAFFVTFSCLLVILASMLGGMSLAAWKVTHTQLHLFISFIAGLMLGLAMLHLLPMAVVHIPDPRWAYLGALIGLLSMFFLIRLFHFHEHSVIETSDDEHHDCHHDHAHDHTHLHSHVHELPHAESSKIESVDSDQAHAQHEHGGHDSHGEYGSHEHPPGPEVSVTNLLHDSASWFGLAMGLAIHSLLDGFALAAAIGAESLHDAFWGSMGVLLAITLHKPLDSMMITSMMIARKSSRRAILFANILFALTCPLGLLMLWFGLAESSIAQAWVLGIALSFSAGVFLCISLGDLLPELHFHQHDRFKLSAALVLGVALAVAIEFLPGHAHVMP
jgi:zinc and cadmium transporter